MTDKTIFGDMTEEEIRKETGGIKKEQPSFIKNLRINQQDIDKNNNDKVTKYRGCFVFWDDVTDQFGYFEKAIIRPFMKLQQFLVYSPQERKYTGESILIKNGEEAKDTFGGTSCNYVPQAKRNELSDDQKKIAQNVGFYTVIYGTVKLDGFNSKDEKLSIDSSFQMKFQRKNGATLRDMIQLTKGVLHQNEFHLTTVPSPTGMGYHLVIGDRVSLDVPADPKENSDDGRLYNLFQKDVSAHNASVLQKYNEAVKKKANDKEAVLKVEAS